MVTIQAQVSVTATAGTSAGTYSTVNEAFAKINDGTHMGNIVITITSGTTEPATPTPLLRSNTPSSYTSVRIVPAGDVIISSAAAPVANRGIIELAGADNVTIDGDDPLTPGTHNLTIQAATVTTAGVAGIRLSSNSATGLDGADNNTVKNCIIIGARPTAVSTVASYGIQFSNGVAASSTSTGAYASINTKIENNIIKRCYYGIYAYGNSVTYYNTGTQVLNNTIGDATVATDNVGLYGIYLSYTAAGATGAAVVSGNTITAGDYTTGFSANVAGIYLGTGTHNTLITKNNIHEIANGSINGWGAHGINLTGASANVTITNNFIRDISAQNYSATLTTSFQNYGIYIGGASTATLINNNSIYLNRPNLTTNGTTPNPVSACIQITSTAAVAQVYNNILVNIQDGTNAYCILTAATANISAAAVNNNAFYVNTGKVGYYAAAGRTTLSDWKAATAKDLASIFVLPDFASPTDLHLVSGATPNQLESAGSAAAGVTTDIDGDSRPGPAGSTNGGGTASDIGADEFDGAPLDLTAPTITYTPIANNANTASLVLTGFASITDPGGVNVAPGTKPRLYFKHADDPDSYTDNTAASQGWKYVEAANATSPFDFTIDYSLLPGGAIPGGRIQYFVTAQDNATTPNVGAFAGAFTTVPSSVALTAANFPMTGTLNSYFVTRVFSGIVNIGTGEAIESLTNAGGLFDVLNNNMLGANLTVNIVSDLTNETGAIMLNQLAEQGAGNYTVTIKPVNAAREISGASATALIRLNGADRIVFDGSLTGATDRSLTIKNTATTASTNVIWITSAGTTNGANNITIKNCIIAGTVGTNTTIAGIISGSGVTMGEDAQSPNSDNAIINNAFHSTQNGMYLRGNATTMDQNWLVKDNVFGSVNPAEKHSFRGFLIGNAQNFVIEGNLVEGVQSATASTAAMSGIQVALNVSNGTVRNNRVRDIKQVNTTGYGAYGINISAATTASNVTVYNNFVSDIAGKGSATLANNGHGIYINAGGGYNLYYNTVSLSSDQVAATGITAGLLVTAGTSLNIRNNIFSNTQTIGNRYAVYSSIATGSNAASFTSFDHNAYGSAGTNLAYFSGAAKADLAALQAAFATANLNSKQLIPVFADPLADLHLLNDPANLELDDAATPVTGITTDIDNQPRSTTSPDIGADEIPMATGLDIKASDLTSPAITQGCYNSEAVKVLITNNSVTPLNLAANPVTVNVNVSGAASANLSTLVNTGTLASGASLEVTVTDPFVMSNFGQYTFAISLVLTGDVSTANNALSFDRVKQTLAPGTIEVMPESYCVTGGAPKLTATGMEGYSSLSWQTSTNSGSGYTAIPSAGTPVYTLTGPITQTMYYRAAFSCGTSTIYSDIDSAVILNPQVLTTTPGYTCGTGTVNLAATGGNGTTLNWYAAATGGASLGNGNTFTTPVISNTTNYYVSAMYGITGNTARIQPASTAGNSAYTAGVIFNATTAFKLNSVDVYLTGAAGTANIQLQTSSGTVLAQTGSISFPAGNATTPLLYTIPLNFDVPVATGLVLARIPGTAAMVGGEAGWGAPLSLTVGGTTFGEITSGYWWGVVTDYYFFYNWSIGAGCESPRTAVTATVNNDPGCTLPVTLTSFTGQHRDGRNLLSWITATEINNAGFELMRSADGINFSKLAFVASKAENGNSSAAITYSFTDEKPFETTSYYRLKQVDKDGKYSLSGIVALKGRGISKVELVNLYPNPAKHRVNLGVVSQKAMNAGILVMDVAGKIVQQRNVQLTTGDNQVSLNTQQLAPGSYLIKLTCADGCETSVKHFIKE